MPDKEITLVPEISIAQVASLLSDEHNYDDVNIMLDPKQYVQPDKTEVRLFRSLIIMIRDTEDPDHHPILGCSVTKVSYSMDYRWWTFHVVLKRDEIESLSKYLSGTCDDLITHITPWEDVTNGN